MKKLIKKLSAMTLVMTVFLSLFGMTQHAQAATSTSEAGIVSTASGSLNVRASASTSASILTALPKGTHVTLISKSGDFWKVEYASGSYGYVHAGYITKVHSSAKRVNVSWGSLNVRSGGGTYYSVVSKLPAGKVVVRLSASYGWSKILYDGTKIGYVDSRYLSDFGSSAMTWPVPKSSRINQYFASGSHNGLDIGASVIKVSGDPVVAAYGGTVVYSGWFNGYGYVAYINSYYNGQYIQTRYAHLQSAPYVKAGDTVSTGQTIGAMGNTGTSTGAHLHFEVRIRKSNTASITNADSTPVNPLNYVSY